MLDVNPSLILSQGEINPDHVLIERGDVILVRNDITHRGCKNLTDHEHFRVHCFCDPEIFDGADDSVKVADQFRPIPHFDANVSRHVNPFN